MSTQPQVWRDASVITVAGQGATDFLQGYLTFDTTHITARALAPMALCNVKGRVVASGWALLSAEGIRLVVHVSLADRVCEFLKPYAMFSKCSLRLEPLLLTPAGDGSIDGGPALAPLKFNLTEPSAGDAETPDCSAAMNAALVRAGFAFVTAANSEQFLPQMLGLDEAGAVDFDKGCYLGQEIVARAQFRGAVKRRLERIQWQGEAPEPGSPWPDTIGVISVADQGGHGEALAVVSQRD